jgi:hypothetical protein
MDTSKNKGNLNHLKIIQKMYEQHNWKAWHPGTTENSHNGHCAHTLESINVKAQNADHEKYYMNCIL